MNTTTNTRGVSEAMVERFKAAFAEHSTISPAYDGCIRAGIEAALSAEPAAQGEDRQEAFVCSNPQCGVVHAVDPCGFCPACVQESGAGWSTSRRRYYGRAQKMRPSAEWYRNKIINSPDEPSLIAAAPEAFTAPPAQPAERVPDEGWVLVPREALGYVSDLLTERKHGTAGRSPAHNARVVVDYWLTATPAPSEGGKGVEAVSHYVPPKPCTCLTIKQREYCADRHVCRSVVTQSSTGAAR